MKMQTMAKEFLLLFKSVFTQEQDIFTSKATLEK
jgi:hypothetical protein